MNTIDPETITLTPDGDGALTVGLGLGAEPGTLIPQLLVTTANLGAFRIPLTAHDLGLITAWGKTVLSMTEQQAADLIRELTNNEGTDNA